MYFNKRSTYFLVLKFLENYIPDHQNDETPIGKAVEDLDIFEHGDGLSVSDLEIWNLFLKSVNQAVQEWGVPYSKSCGENELGVSDVYHVILAYIEIQYKIGCSGDDPKTCDKWPLLYAYIDLLPALSGGMRRAVKSSYQYLPTSDPGNWGEYEKAFDIVKNKRLNEK